MLLNILFTILGLFTLVYIESIFLALLGIRLFVILFFFFLRRVEWKLFFILSAIALLIFDVVYKMPLGSNILILTIPFALYLIISMFVSLDSGLVSYFVKIFLFWLYYILMQLLSNLFVVGEFGSLIFNDLLSALLRAVLSTLILLLLEYIYARFRKRGNNSQIQLK